MVGEERNRYLATRDESHCYLVNWEFKASSPATRARKSSKDACGYCMLFLLSKKSTLPGLLGLGTSKPHGGSPRPGWRSYHGRVHKPRHVFVSATYQPCFPFRNKRRPSSSSCLWDGHSSDSSRTTGLYVPSSMSLAPCHLCSWAANYGLAIRIGGFLAIGTWASEVDCESFPCHGKGVLQAHGAIRTFRAYFILPDQLAQVDQFTTIWEGRHKSSSSFKLLAATKSIPNVHPSPAFRFGAEYVEYGWNVISSVSYIDTRPLFCIADVNIIKQIGTIKSWFPKNTDIYRMLEIYGPNLVSAEGAHWTRLRKIVSPAFSEQNVQLVWWVPPLSLVLS